MLHCCASAASCQSEVCTLSPAADPSSLPTPAAQALLQGFILSLEGAHPLLCLLQLLLELFLPVLLTAQLPLQLPWCCSLLLALGRPWVIHGGRGDRGQADGGTPQQVLPATYLLPQGLELFLAPLQLLFGMGRSVHVLQRLLKGHLLFPLPLAQLCLEPRCQLPGAKGAV